MASLDSNPNPEDQPQPNPNPEEVSQTILQIEPEVQPEPNPNVEETTTEATNPQIEASIALPSQINEPQPTPTDTGLHKPTNLKIDEEPKPNPEIEEAAATEATNPQIEVSLPLESQSGPIERQTNTGLDKPGQHKDNNINQPEPESKPEEDPTASSDNNNNPKSPKPETEQQTDTGLDKPTEASISLPSQFNEPQSNPIEQQTDTGLAKPTEPPISLPSQINEPQSNPIEQQTDTGLTKPTEAPISLPSQINEPQPITINQQTNTGLAKPENNNNNNNQPKPESDSISEEDPTATASSSDKSPKPEIELDDEPLAKKPKQEQQPPEPMLVEETVTVTKSKSKSKKKNNNVWVTKTTRKGKKKTKANNTTNSATVEDKVLITPIPRFPDKSDDTPELEICLSKVYKAEKVEVSEDRLTATSSKGYRMVRATRGAIEGAWYYEVKVVSLGESGHTRLGWSNDKGDLQAPVGYDGNSFGFRDVDGCKVHKALREVYGEEGYKEGDVIGFYICLPDGEGFAPKAPRYVWYKGQRYVCAPDDNEEPPKVVPGSEISFFKNGVCQGVAFTDILGGRYYPAASMYTLPDQSNCVVKFNFGPDFECFPEDFGGRATPKPMCEVPYHGYTGRLESNGSDDMKS